MAYIHFTDEQKRQAGAVNLPEFLRRQGEKLLPSGREFRLDRNHSVTVRGNTWYDHATGEGGGPVSFLQNFLGMSYPEAMSRLLDGAVDMDFLLNTDHNPRERQPFALPPASDNMRRLYAYLLKERCIRREVVNAFVHAKLLYESRELARDGSREYNNAIFVGLDENGIPRHAHKRSLNSVGRSFRMNEGGSDPRCSFHHIGSSDRLFVFEAPIDVLSFITLNPKDWQEHSYLSLCGTADHALLWVLDRYPVLEKISLCLDHDEAGIEAAERLREMLSELGYPDVSVIRPRYKDFNEDLKATHGRTAKPAEEHPQRIVAPEVCRRIGKLSEAVNLSRLQSELPSLLEQHHRFIQWNRTEEAMDRAEKMAALALSACAREMRQTGVQVGAGTLSEVLCQYIQPHQNRANVRNRYHEIGAEMKTALGLSSAAGIRSEDEKKRLVEAWFRLALVCARASVRYEATLYRQRVSRQIAPRSPTLPSGPIDPNAAHETAGEHNTVTKRRQQVTPQHPALSKQGITDIAPDIAASGDAIAEYGAATQNRQQADGMTIGLLSM